MSNDSPFDAADVTHGLTQVGRLGEAVKAEFDLVGVRMTWLVLSESFSFTAFAVSVSNYDPQHRLAGVQLYLIWVLPVVGMLLAGCVFAAIRAAHRAARQLKGQRDRMMARLPEHLRINLVRADSPEHWWGDLPPHVIPPALFLVWLGVLVWILVLWSQGRMA